MEGDRESKNEREGLCILKGITVIKVTELADLISFLIQVAKPSLSQSWSHQATDTRFPNHWWAISWHTRIATYCFLQRKKHLTRISAQYFIIIMGHSNIVLRGAIGALRQTV